MSTALSERGIRGLELPIGVWQEFPAARSSHEHQPVRLAGCLSIILTGTSCLIESADSSTTHLVLERTA